MLPSTTIDDDTAAGLPRLTVHELRALGRAHYLGLTFHPAAPEHGRGHAGVCACGVAFTLCRSAREVADEHAQHVDEEIRAARRAKARRIRHAAIYTPRHRATAGGGR